MKAKFTWLALLLLVAVNGFGQVVGGVMRPSARQPFSAERISETTQVLTDGNRIHRETRGAIYRDSQGRTRDETEIAPPLPGVERFQIIHIFDPVQQVIISFDTRAKIAHVHHFAPPNHTVNSVPAVVQNGSVGVVAPAGVPRQQQVTLQHEKLGTMDIEGITAEGTRLTVTTAAGVAGNEKPLISVTESWVSRDLGEILLSKRTDPRSGETITKLVNIQRYEPDPALFQIPPDYTVRDDQNTQ